MNEEQVVALMESATSSQDWNAKADQVKKACGGYPPFWFKAIVISGLMNRVITSFGGDPSIRVSTPDSNLLPGGQA